ncbi:hypothetical protein KR018_001352 [Drosophila ironensis]|nr:hypothetical protein KR018_001352 [Drosophila ironensis]
MSVVIETTLGDLTVDLFTGERPIACLNFLKLCRLKYYNFNLFHTVQQGFIAQTGDPSGSGDGGCSVWGVIEGAQKRFFEAETLPRINHSSAGILSLVGAGKNLAASQFFFTLGDSLSSLDGEHCVIGEVVEGHEVLRKLNDAIVDEKYRPYQDIRITHTVILDDPFPNPRGLQVPSRSPSPSAERLKNGRIAADEDINDTEGLTLEEVQEMIAEREAKARATILEIVGDLPDADMAPPENVLFVCKLNPVTNDDDLEIIFSRFGAIKGCEVIRDRKTGDSLQYAFVEFEERKSCEAAYFKMDNVLIDDRRIHVDFSQSVSKVTWRGKGRGIVGAEGRLDFNNLRESRPSNGRRRDDRQRERKRSPEPRMSSAERRKAREQRHQEQKQRDERRRSRSRSRDRQRDEGLRDRQRNEGQRDRQRDEGQRDRQRNDGQRDRQREEELRDRNGRRRSRERLERKHSRSRDREEKRRSRDRVERRRSQSRDKEERRRSRSRDRGRQGQSRDVRRERSPQDRRRQENGSQKATKIRDKSTEQRSQGKRPETRDRESQRHNASRKGSPERKRRPSKSVEKRAKKKAKRAASSSSESSESSSESDSSSSDTSEDSSTSSSSSDERSKRKKKSKSKKSHKSKKKSHRK